MALRVNAAHHPDLDRIRPSRNRVIDNHQDGDHQGHELQVLVLVFIKPQPWLLRADGVQSLIHHPCPVPEGAAPG